MTPNLKLEAAVRCFDGGARGALLDAMDPKLQETAATFTDLAAKLGASCHLVYSSEMEFPDSLKVLKDKDSIRGFVALGNITLLQGTMVGICGSRKATSRGLDIAGEICGDLASEGAIIVSGYAAGVDESAHRAALARGGKTVCVLAEGINHFRIKRSLRDVWDWNNILVVSQFGFSTIWQASRAMQRNKTIVGMSKATLVVEARDTGGTLDAGFTALKLRKPLLVVDYAESNSESAGNKMLIENGGIPFRKKRTTGVPAFENLNRILGKMH